MSKRNVFEFLSRSLSTITRHPSSRKTSIDSAKSNAQEILDEFRHHNANHHSLFQYLAETSKERGLTPAQYMVYRDNFLYRTANTVVSVATHLAKAVAAHDYQALARNVKNLSDEGGNGDPEGVHLQLLENSHNDHGEIVFGVPRITIPESNKSQFLIPEVFNFRKMQQMIFRSSYQTMTGCILAHEDAADDMLTGFRKTVFEPFQGYYHQTGFKKLMHYYDEHRDDSKENGNIEEQHKEQALEIATRVIFKDPRAASLIRRGGLKFLAAQNALWTGLETAIESKKHHGQPVPAKSEFLPETKTKLEKFSRTLPEVDKNIEHSH